MDVKVCDKCGERIKLLPTDRTWRVGATLQTPGVTSSDRNRGGEACSERCAHQLLDEMVSSLKCAT